MINRENWKAVNLYLAYRSEVDMIGVSSVRLDKSWLRHVLIWADNKSFSSVFDIRPSYPQYVRSLGLSSVYSSHLVRSARRFFRWLSVHRRGYHSISSAWLDTLKISLENIDPYEHEAVTLAEVRAMASAEVLNICERRVRASAVFLFLSGMRIGAFVSLPVLAVDLDNLSIRQWPKLGVKTKNKKKATTYLLDIPDLLEVVCAWHEEILLAGSYFWFAPVSPFTWVLDPDKKTVGSHRNIKARKDLHLWLSRVGLPYHSPHKFRHGNAVYSLKNAKTIAALKAVSQNLMHANLSVTDGIYGILSDLDVKNEIHSLGKK